MADLKLKLLIYAHLVRIKIKSRTTARERNSSSIFSFDLVKKKEEKIDDNKIRDKSALIN